MTLRAEQSRAEGVQASHLDALDTEKPERLEFRPREFFDPDFRHGMTSILGRLVKQFGFPTGERTVQFDMKMLDINIGGYDNKGDFNSKGYCSFLSTTVALALREYIYDNAGYTQGFAIIDSPVHGLDEGEREITLNSMTRAMFTYSRQEE